MLIIIQKNYEEMCEWASMYIKEKKYKRDSLINFLKKNNIETWNGFYSSNYLKYFKKNKKLKNSDFLSRTLINLPIFEELKIHEQKFIINKVKNFFNG